MLAARLAGPSHHGAGPRHRHAARYSVAPRSPPSPPCRPRCNRSLMPCDVGVCGQPLRGWLDDLGDDPAVLADLAIADESKLLVDRQGAVEEEAGRNRTRGFRI